jgi:integrase
MSAHILVVDDDEPSLEVLVEMLALEHYVVSTATDGFEGLAKIAAEKPDIVLLDVMMPELDGFESSSAYTKYRLGQGVKPGTAAKELAVLRAAINHCVRNGHLTAAPFVRMPPKTPGRNRWLTASEAANLLRASRRTRHLALFILIALYTGARGGAILGLRWDQVDLERGRVDFNQPGRPITNKRRPIIPIPRQLLWFLRAARQRSDSPWVIAYPGRSSDEYQALVHPGPSRSRARFGRHRAYVATHLRHMVGSEGRRPLPDCRMVGSLQRIYHGALRPSLTGLFRDGSARDGAKAAEFRRYSADITRRRQRSVISKPLI